jgi:hypothetical protein
VHETPWVRSVYLYLMCIVSIGLVALGAVGFVVGAVHAVAPDLGHRDTLDRVGIGLSNIAGEVVDLVGQTENGDAEEFCRSVTDNDDDFEDCLADEGSGGEEMDAIQDGISEVRSELESQIRNNAIDHMIRGLLMIGVGVLLFRIHANRTELYANGLMPSGPPQDAGPTPDVVYVAPAPERVPPPPGAPPAV